MYSRDLREHEGDPSSSRAGLLRYVHQLQADYRGQTDSLPYLSLAASFKQTLTRAEMYPSPSQPIPYPTPPNALEALRMIHRSRPAVIQGP
jgi:hypothetical protein